ncbi:Leucine aminopeptidase 1 [Arthrobotrys megalospora]
MPPPLNLCHPTPIFPPSTFHTSQINTLLTSATAISPTLLTTDLKHLTTSFKTRYFRSTAGRDAAVWIHRRLESIINDSSHPNASVSFYNHTWIQPSVITRIQGVSNTTIILSTHLDSLNLYLPLLLPAPGANDDASGVSALISIISTLLSPKLPLHFTNTLEFHFYSAEEAGFWGSSEVLGNYNKEYRDIHSVLQFDMIGKVNTFNNNKNGKEEPGEIGIVNDFLGKGFRRYIKLIVGEYTGLKAVDTYCGYACSDHASAIRFGYPGGLLTSGRLEDVKGGDYSHTGGDTVDKLDLEGTLQFVRFGVAWGVELGFAELGGTGRRGYLCDNGYPDGWMGGVRRFSAARAADPVGFGLWILVLVVLLGVARPWEEFPGLMRVGRRFRRGVRRGYTVLIRDAPD